MQGRTTHDLEYRQRWLSTYLRNHCLERGQFTLKSGALSNYYLDVRKATLHGMAMRTIVSLIIDRLEEQGPLTRFQAVGGPTVGADPIVGGLLHDATYYPDLRGYLVRSQAKDHGKEGRVIGSLRTGDRCLLVEDVITSGGTTLDTVAVLQREYQAQVTEVVCVVDRLAGARERLLAQGIQLHSLLTVADLGVG